MFKRLFKLSNSKLLKSDLADETWDFLNLKCLPNMDDMFTTFNDRFLHYVTHLPATEI